MIKTILIVLLTLTFAAFSACGSAATPAAVTDAPVTTFAPSVTDAPESSDAPVVTSGAVVSVAREDIAFAYNGVTVTLGGKADDFISRAGAPDDIFESPSCAFEGIDKILYYPGFIINTFPVDGVDYVLAVILDSAVTPEGVGVDSPLQSVLDAYGAPDEQDDSQMKYVNGDSELTFILDRGAVFDITYYFTGTE